MGYVITNATGDTLAASSGSGGYNAPMPSDANIGGPAQPAAVNCWDNYVFDVSTCSWNNTGSQPAQPAVVDCWDVFSFNTTTCSWDNIGSQPAQPAVVAVSYTHLTLPTKA